MPTLAGDFAPVRAIRCADLDEAVAIANAYAPEHLSLACDETASRIDDVRNAGAVFVGAASAESFGDYLAGSSHVLPTDGAARFTGGVSTLTFLKAMTVQRISPATAASACRAGRGPGATRRPGSPCARRRSEGGMSVALRLARAAIRDLPPVDIAGAPLPDTIRLDANENPYAALVTGQPTINRYPEPQPATLRARLAALYGVAPERLWVTRGSDDAIDLLIRTFCEAGQDCGRDRRADLFRLRPVRPGAGRAGRDSAADGRFQVRRRCGDRGDGGRSAQAAVPVHAQQSDRHARRSRRRSPDRRGASRHHRRRGRSLCGILGRGRPGRRGRWQPGRPADPVQGLWPGRRADWLRHWQRRA